MRAKRGFTLIELLVIIVIISITASIALFAFGDFGASRKAVITAEQFITYVKLVQQRAILEMNTLGIAVNQDGYETYRFEQGLAWQPTFKNNLLRRHAFPKNVVVFLTDKKIHNKAPDIIITSAGDMTSFKLNFGTASEPEIVTLIGQHNGEIILRNHDSK